MHMKSLLCRLLLGCICLIGVNGFTPLLAGSVWVSPSGDDETGDGTQLNPYQTIGFALGQSNADTLWLRGGTYSENIQINAALTGPRALISADAAIGDSALIEAPAAGPAIDIFNIPLANGQDGAPAALIELKDLKISHANGVDGPGVYCDFSSDGDLLIDGCRFENNNNPGAEGGAVYYFGSVARSSIRNSFFLSNSAQSGAAIFAENATILVENNYFSGNNAALGGGAIALKNCFDVLVDKNRFYGNSAQDGGAVQILSQSIETDINHTYANNVFAGNSAGASGGALYYNGNALSSFTQFRDNVFAENEAQLDGAAVYAMQTSPLILSDNIVLANRAGQHGGAFAFSTMGTAAINVWSNQISGNSAADEGGAIYINGANSFSLGGGSGTQNNLFHNRARNGLNNIFSELSISSLRLENNYWGSTDQTLVGNQLDIPSINNSWTNFASEPVEISQKLFAGQQKLWFADGFIRSAQQDGFFSPRGDSLFTFTVDPDSNFSIPGKDHLPKYYQFGMDGVGFDPDGSELTFFLDGSELDRLGNPVAENITVFRLNGNWNEVSTTQFGSEGNAFSTTVDSFQNAVFSLGLLFGAEDTLVLVDPRPNRYDLGANVPLRVLFQQKMNPATLNDGSVFMRGRLSGQSAVDLSYDDQKDILYIEGQKAFAAGETIELTLTDSVKTAEGASFINGYSWSLNRGAFRGSGGFAPVDQSSGLSGTRQYATANLDEDAQVELLALEPNSLQAYKRTDSGFQSLDALNLTEAYTMLRSVDLDNDGAMEAVLLRDNEMRAYRYDPLSGFAASPLFTRALGGGSTLRDVYIADFNNDGIVDFALLRDFGSFRQFDLAFGSSEGGYSLDTFVADALNGNADALASLDWDGDGLFDLVSTRGDGPGTLALIHNRKGSYELDFPMPGGLATQKKMISANIAESDVFSNRREIIIAGNNGGNDLLKGYNVDEEGALIETFDGGSFGANVIALESADISSDGRADILTGLDNNTIELLLSNADGSFSTQTLNTALAPQKIVAADFDGDDDLDILIYSNNQGQTSWQLFENASRPQSILYVEAGQQDGDGTISNPFGTIGQAVQRSFPGDFISVRPGVYEENLRIRHDITISAEDSNSVFLVPGPDALVYDGLVDIKNASNVQLAYLNLANRGILPQARGLAVENTDSLYTFDLESREFNVGAEVINSGAIFERSRFAANDRGVRLENALAEFNDVSADSNRSFGIESFNSQLTLNYSRLARNGQSGLGENGGLALRDNSEATLFYSSVDSNLFANLIVEDSYAGMQFVYLANARPKVTNLSGAGIIARNKARLDIENTALFDNARYGGYFNDSQVNVLNSIVANNDSLAQLGGGALFFRNGAVADVRNTILLGNNAPLDAQSSNVTLEYNNFFANAQAPQGVTPGTGNINANPLFVFQYNPIGESSDIDGFADLKLAPGSPLIDAGDPQITNGSGSSRSDIGFYGNLGLPFVPESVPEIQTTVVDSSIVFNWQAAAEDSLSSGIVLFKSETNDFAPDTSNILAILGKEVLTYTDEQVQFGRDYFYRAAFIDTGGGAFAYTESLRGRLDFLALGLAADSLNVQLGQGDTLRRPVTVSNLGTLPVTVRQQFSGPDWLTVSPAQREIEVGGNAVFFLSFSSEDLERDTTYSTNVLFSTVEDQDITQALSVNMFVSYRDLMAPRTIFASLRPDTVLQAAASMRFTGFDSTFSSIGTPTRLLSYAYRFGRVGENNNVSWIEQDTTNQNGVDFFPLEDGRYFFEVAALDTAANGGFGANSQTWQFRVDASQFNIARRLWQMRTIPRSVTSADVDIAPDVETQLRFWKNGMYEYATIDSLKPGKAFWVITRDRKRIDLSRFDFLNSEQPYTIALQRGWNMIGSPWSWSIRWSRAQFETAAGNSYSFEEALNEGLINGGTYRYRPGTPPGQDPYEQVTNDLMLHHIGYWLFVETDQQLSLRYDPQPYLSSEDALEKTAPGSYGPEEDALIRIAVNDGKYSDTENIFGVTTQPESYPFYLRGSLEPPAIENNMRLFASENGRIYNTLLKKHSGRDDTYIWDLILEVGDAQSEAVMTWENLKPAGNMYFFLYHLESGEWFNMEERENFILDDVAGTQHFKVYASADAAFEPQVLPTRFELHQNYPNPFNPQTTILLDVPFFADGTNVKLVIYDVLGRQVKTLLDGVQPSGTAKITWDGKNDSGKQVASGVYFYSLRSRLFTASRKMVLIR